MLDRSRFARDIEKMLDQFLVYAPESVDSIYIALGKVLFSEACASDGTTEH